MAFFKKLTCLALAFVLFSLHVETGAIAWSSAYALDDQVPQFENVDLPNITNESNSGNDGASTAAAAQGSNNSLDFRSSEQKMGKMTMAQIMTAMALIVGPSMIMMCPNQPSALIFGAGGVIMLVMEIMNYSSYKKASTSTQEMYAELDPETNMAQIDAFIAAAEQERNAAAALQKKASAIGTFATMSTVAAVIAAVELVLRILPYTSRDDTCSGGSASILTPNADQAMYASSQIWLAPIKDESFTGYMTRVSEMNSYYFSDAIQTPTSSESFSIAQDVEKNLLSTENTNQMLNAFYAITTTISDLIISKANAKESETISKGPLSAVGIGSAVLGTVMALKVTTWTPVKTLFSTPYASSGARIGIFGLFAGMGFAAKSEVTKAAERLEDNARVYDNLRDQLLRSLASQGRFAGMGGAQGQVRNRVAAYQGVRDEAMNPPNGSLCLVGPPAERRVDQKCACAKNNTCAKAGFSSVGFEGQGLPGFFSESVDGLANGTNSLFAGNLSGASSAFGGVSQNAAKIRKLKDQTTAKANKILKDKKIGNTVEDFEKEFEKKFMQEAPRLLASLPSDQQGLVTGLGFGSTGTGLALDDLKKKDPKEILANVQAAIGKNPAAGGGGFKFDFAEEANPNTGGEDMNLSQSDALSDFESNESDISDRPNENIFNIITVRYFKSAYPRFFNEGNKEKESLD